LEEWGIYCGFLPPSEDRLYGSLQDKAAKHKTAADNAGLPFVIFLFGCFNSFLGSSEVRNCLSGEHGLFGLYPQLSGAYHFQNVSTIEEASTYQFQFSPNEHATRPITLPSGWVPRPIPAR